MSTAAPFLLDPRNREAAAGDMSRLRPARNAGVIAWLMIPFLLAGVFVSRHAVEEGRVYARLAAEGVCVQALVTDRRVETDGDGDSHYVAYRYEVAGHRYRHEEQVGSRFYDRASPGTALPIRYIRSLPATSRPDTGELVPRKPLLLGGFALVWDLIVGATSFFVLRSLWLTRLLRREGRLLSGRLQSCEAKVDSDGELTLTVCYGFRTPEGAWLEGEARARRDDLKGQPLPAAGSPVWVSYLDEKRHQLL